MKTCPRCGAATLWDGRRLRCVACAYAGPLRLRKKKKKKKKKKKPRRSRARRA